LLHLACQRGAARHLAPLSVTPLLVGAVRFVVAMENTTNPYFKLFHK